MAGIRFGCSVGSGAHRISGRILLQAGNRRKQKSSETVGNQENGFTDEGGPFLVRKFDICMANTIKTTVKESKIDTKNMHHFQVVKSVALQSLLVSPLRQRMQSLGANAIFKYRIIVPFPLSRLVLHPFRKS